ncbi:MAG TPA: hypothetical protein VGW38_28095 [Chloroflexota bacterium]|nr:hypothetical protein [Chloroflexota bacterium]
MSSSFSDVSLDASRSGAVYTTGTDAESPLLPRYRRPLAFSAILDETFRIFRSAWVPLMLALAIAAVPNALIGALLQAIGVNTLVSTATSDLAIDDPEAFLRSFGSFGVAALVASLVTALLMLPAIGAVTVIADGVMRDLRPTVGRAFLAGIRRTPAMLASSIVAGVALFLLSLAAIPLFVLGIFGTLGSLIALIALLVWWGNPRARRPWVKWLIILATPMGLPVYYGIRWSLILIPIVLEHAGPLRALQRSAYLSRGNWFRVAGVTFVLGLVASFLQAIPAWIASLITSLAMIPLSEMLASVDETIGFTFFALIQLAASWLGWVIFGSVPFIGLTVLFTDLRNRHEGADLSERLGVLERPTASTL